MNFTNGQVMDWIDSQHTQMLDQTIEWSNINTYTFNLLGLKTLSEKLVDAFSVLDEDIHLIDLPTYHHINSQGILIEKILAPIIVIQKRPSAPKQGLFVIHLDTQYPPSDSLQESYIIEGQMLKGQGVSDAKGGIAVLLKTLEAFEKSKYADNIGWTIIINTDEKIGSPCSSKILESKARRSDLGFIFEPCLPDGNLIGARKGSGYFTLVARRMSPADKSNPIDTIVSCINELQQLNKSHPHININVGVVHGGSALNAMPKVALTRFDVKISNLEDQIFIEEQLRLIVEKFQSIKNIQLELHGEFLLPPKPLDERTLILYEQFRDCGSELGLSLDWEDSKRVCDGNRLHAFGLPTIDTLGVQGAKTEQSEEYMYIESLKERAKLTSLSLIKWACGEWRI